MKNYWTIFLATLTLVACSTDADDDVDSTNGDNALVGTWNLTDVRFDEDPNDTTLNFADELVDQLVEDNCFLVTFTFNGDSTVTSTDKLNFVEVNAGPNGLEVPCPSQSDDLSGTWSLSGNQLTIDDGAGDIRTLTIELNGNILILNGADIDENNYDGAEAVFTKQ